jgi:hypothetical protein
VRIWKSGIVQPDVAAAVDHGAEVRARGESDLRDQRNPSPHNDNKMQIPPSKLWQYLQGKDEVLLCDEQGKTKPIAVEYARKVAAAGLIEGVVHGKVNPVLKVVRWLRAGAIPDPKADLSGREEVHTSRSTVTARTNMGVYREPLCHVEVSAANRDDKRVVVGEGEVSGYAYAFCASRAFENPR